LTIPASGFDPQKILVIRFARLGDVVLLVPALQALRKRFPKAVLDVLVDHRYAPVLQMCPVVNEVIAVDRVQMRDSAKFRALWSIFGLAQGLRNRKYDLVLDLHSFRETQLLAWYSGAPWRLGLKRVHSAYLGFCFNLAPVNEDDSLHVSRVFLSVLESLGIKAEPEECLLTLPVEQIRWAEEFLKPHRHSGDEWFVGFNVGAGSRSRTWPKDKFASLAGKILLEAASKIIVFSGPEEDEVSVALCETLDPKRVILANNLPLTQLAALMGQCRILISNDTGPMHLAVAAGVPTLGLFSVARPEHYRPLGRFSRFVRGQPIESISVDAVHSEFLKIHQCLQGEDPYG
jgi:ADP-heptose:LPS heptosyltransferase